MLKRIFCTVLAALTAALYVAAEGITLNAGKDFTVYTPGGNARQAAEITGVTEAELKDYCSKNSIVYYAVDGENKRQIRLSVLQTDFSAGAVNLSNLTDDSIAALLPDITGIENVRGEIVYTGAQKFVKTELSSSDSGGEYTVIQYITVAGKKEYVLSFTTSAGVDTGYAKEVFETLKSEDFAEATKKPQKNYGAVILAAVVLLIFACAYIIYTLIRDIRQPHGDGEDDAERKL